MHRTADLENDSREALGARAEQAGMVLEAATVLEDARLRTVEGELLGVSRIGDVEDDLLRAEVHRAGAIPRQARNDGVADIEFRYSGNADDSRDVVVVQAMAGVHLQARAIAVVDGHADAAQFGAAAGSWAVRIAGAEPSGYSRP